jgi:hypothetical protein
MRYGKWRGRGIPCRWVQKPSSIQSRDGGGLLEAGGAATIGVRLGGSFLTKVVVVINAGAVQVPDLCQSGEVVRHSTHVRV